MGPSEEFTTNSGDTPNAGMVAFERHLGRAVWHLASALAQSASAGADPQVALWQTALHTTPCSDACSPAVPAEAITRPPAGPERVSSAMHGKSPPLLTKPELEDYSNIFGWNLSEAELASGLPCDLANSWIEENRRAPLAPLEIAFQPMDCYAFMFVDRLQNVVCEGLFGDLFPDHPFETIMQLDFDAMEPCLPAYRAPGWARERFWDIHCLDLIAAVINNDFLSRRFRLKHPPRTPEEVRQRYQEILASERAAWNAGGSPHGPDDNSSQR